MKKSVRSFGVLVLSWTLILQIAFGSLILSTRNQAMAMPGASEGSKSRAAILNELHSLTGELLMDPTIAAIEQDSANDSFQLHLSPKDPIVDQDPYFLRGQAWSAPGAANSTDSVIVRHDSKGLEIQARGQNRVWRLNAPLRPVLATDEYIYLAANEASFFHSKDNGQGLFVVPYQKLLGSGPTGARVPVFYMPLPGTGWTGQSVSVTEVPHRDLVLIRNESGVELPVLVDDVRSVVKIESVNMLFAISQAMDGALEKLKARPSEAERVRASLLTVFAQIAKEADAKGGAPSAALVQAVANHHDDAIAAIESITGAGELDLPRGATAGFGVMYTGFDLAHPELGSVMFKTAAAPKSLFQKALDLVRMPRAYALDPQMEKFLGYTIRVLAVTGVIFIGSIVIRHTALKAKIDARAQEAKDQGSAYPLTRQYLDVFAHSMTAFEQFRTVWSAQTLRYALDRMHVGENNVIRNLFNATFGFSLRTSDKTPVNAKTLLFGVGVLGGVDTGLVALQGYILLPWLAKSLAWMVPALAPRVAEAYGPANAAISLYLTLSVIQNFIAYLTNGAYSFAHDVQTIKMQDGEREVREQMKGEGKDPSNLRHKKEYDRRVKDYVRQEMRKKGLPEEKDFLFDANTLYGKTLTLFGYEAPRGEDPSHYKALERPGLMVRAISRAVSDAEAALKQDSTSLEKRAEVELLRELRSDMSLLYGFLEHPSWYLSVEGMLNIAQTFKRARTELTALTFDGPRDAPIDTLPETWLRRHPDGAKGAAQRFRYAFLTMAHGLDPVNPVLARIIKYAKLPFVLLGKGVTAPFKYADLQFEEWQIRHALTRAKEAYVAQTGQSPDEVMAEIESDGSLEAGKTYRAGATRAASSNKKLWDALLQKELVRVAGLFPDYKNTELLTQVEAQASEKIKRRLETDTDLILELGKLSPTERNKRIALQKADYFSASYTEATIQKEVVGPLDPAQPGVFQRLRQIGFVRQSPKASYLLRGIEGLMSNTRYGRGLWPQLTRVIPLLEDLTQGTLVAYRNLPVKASVGYTWSSVVWGSALPRVAWFINTALLEGPTVRGPWMTTMRVTGNLGIKPNDKITGMLKYGTIGSFATMWGMFFYPLFEKDLSAAVNNVITVCQRLLTGQ